MISSSQEAVPASAPITAAPITAAPAPEYSGAAHTALNPSTELLALELPRLRVVVRPMRQADMRALEWHGGSDLRHFYEAQWVAHSEGTVAALIADLNGFPIGQAAIHWHGKPTHPQIPDIQSLRVFAAFRGLGIGTLLLQASENLVRARGYERVSLAVGLENPKARRLYERLEYSATGEPYNDIWYYTNAQGQSVRVEEMVVDLVKTLTHEGVNTSQP